MNQANSHTNDDHVAFDETSLKVGQTVKTYTGQRGVIFSTNGLMVVVIQIRNDSVYREIGTFHHTKVTASN